MKILNAERADLGSLVNIWCECFGDTQDVPTAFYKNVRSDVLVAKENGRVLGVINIVPVTLNERKGGYVYATGVSKEFRGTGIFDLLLKAADSFLVEKGAAFICLVPGDEKLAETYTKRGYTKRIVRFNPEGTIGSLCDKIEAASDFSDFAEPENASEYNFNAACPYGLLKPLSKDLKISESLCFSGYMGEA